ncbi:MAG: pilus assembly protein PilM [Planctomycetaceae bacterium]|jgi:type IV pilus assembly protein PilM|nr:pilus assembly protein PilM [Planctomycetaceae bacterium]
MARSRNVWGIDIGKCGLKALRCSLSPQPGKLVAETFDYIEYPMLLTQPEADPTELIRDALEEFLRRNDVAGDTIAVSVPGQSGLSKFIKLPPVEASKIPDIVTYEARQQIPFPLEQVVWSWQRLEGGIEESGFVIDAEIALFAMKRDQVTKAIEPFKESDIEIDLLQLSPVSLANVVMFDQLPNASEIDPDAPPASIVLASMGVDTTDLVITNGLKIWQRTMPIGGNNFTRALVQGMRMTFAKAENLKRNAARADDPKKVFQTLRPVFNEFASELQRSLNYFTGQDRTAKIGQVLLVGNAAKLRGLSDFLAKQLQLEVHRLREFKSLEGDLVLKAPVFRENQLGFSTVYGLCLQGLGVSSIRTNLLPSDVTRDRLIQAKKPWAVAAMLGLLVAALINFFGIYIAWSSYSENLFADAFTQVDSVVGKSSQIQSSLEQVQAEQLEILDTQQRLARISDRRFQSLDLIRAIESMIPRDEPDKTDASLRDAIQAEKAEAAEEANGLPVIPVSINYDELHINSLDCQYFEDLSTWFEPLEEDWKRTVARDQFETNDAPEKTPATDTEGQSNAESEANTESESEADTELGEPSFEPEESEPEVPAGEGWVVQLVGHHFHNEDYHAPFEGRTYLRTTLIESLLGERGEIVTVTAGPEAGKKVLPKEIGIGFPAIIESSPIENYWLSTAVDSVGDDGMGMGPSRGPTRGASGELLEEGLELKRYDFIIQFVWQPKTPGAVQIITSGETGDNY